MGKELGSKNSKTGINYRRTRFLHPSKFPVLCASTLVLLAMTSNSVFGKSKTLDVNQTEKGTSEYTGVQFLPNDSLMLASPSLYVYGPSADFNGDLPPDTLIRKGVLDPLSWYRNIGGYGVVNEDIISTEPDYIQPIITKFTRSADTRSHTAVGPIAPVYTSNGPTFDVDVFEQGIREKMDDETLGYAYVINYKKKHARSDGRGFARSNNDAYVSQSQYKRMNIASISKTITAVAVLQLLELNGLSVYDPVGVRRKRAINMR